MTVKVAEKASYMQLHHQAFCKVLGVSPKQIKMLCEHVLASTQNDLSQSAGLNKPMEKYQYNSLDKYTGTLEIFSLKFRFEKG